MSSAPGGTALVSARPIRLVCAGSSGSGESAPRSDDAALCAIGRGHLGAGAARAVDRCPIDADRVRTVVVALEGDGSGRDGDLGALDGDGVRGHDGRGRGEEATEHLATLVDPVSLSHSAMASPGARLHFSSDEDDDAHAYGHHDSQDELDFEGSPGPKRGRSARRDSVASTSAGPHTVACEWVGCREAFWELEPLIDHLTTGAHPLTSSWHALIAVQSTPSPAPRPARRIPKRREDPSGCVTGAAVPRQARIRAAGGHCWVISARIRARNHSTVLDPVRTSLILKD